MPLALSGGYSAVQFRYPAELSLTLRKIAHFCIGNLICAQYRFIDGYYLNVSEVLLLNKFWCMK